MMTEYLNLFVDREYPVFLNRYLITKTMKRLKYVTQFCGCDYTNLYQPKFLYTRFDHSLVVAHMTWHFTHDKKETLAALLHDIGTPCFAHTIDFLLGDSINQESSEETLSDVIARDEELKRYLKEDDIPIEDLSNLEQFPILENHSPRLCTDRLDGVLHTCYIWLHTNSLSEIKEVYDDIIVLQNEAGRKELGFKNLKYANSFARMTRTYAKELQGNRDKYVMKYISEALKKVAEQNLITLSDLYQKKESEIVSILREHISSWSTFEHVTNLTSSNEKPNQFFVSVESKKRNVVPLVQRKTASKRIDTCSKIAKKIYDDIASYHDEQYAYIPSISKIG